MNKVVEDVLMHYGMPKRSGRYPWGSGDNPYQHSGDFLSRVQELSKMGKTEKQIADEMQISTTELRAAKAIAARERKAEQAKIARDLRDNGYSLAAIAKQMGYANDSSVRALLSESSEEKRKAATATVDVIREGVDKYGMIDVGAGVEVDLGISKEKLKAALTELEMEGYPVWTGSVPQATNPGRQTHIRVIGKPGTEHKDIYEYDKVHNLGEELISHDGGETFDPKWVYPKSMDSNRLQIRYGDQGGAKQDGLVELRRGVPDLDLGNSNYAQVRILVDGTHYIKGMAVYADDLPPGIDVRFNTNKSSDKAKLDVLKPINTKDPDNPFGSLIKEGINDPDHPSDKRGGQSYYYDENGKKQLSLINKRAEEGDWSDWSDKLPAQFLAKQSKDLIDKQLNLTRADREAEFAEICACTNPTIKRKLLQTFADECDASAVHLKAAALPGQKYQVILPLKNIKDTEVYAPNFKDGETVALVRYPHAGTFEIPILKVNNHAQEGVSMLGKTPADAVGINSKVAERLSGADFDGDTVMVIPCNSRYSGVKITSTPILDGLKDFDPKMAYPEVKGMKYMKDPKTGKDGTQIEMGKISNLITDMTLLGADDKELARAVRHSMVVIDAAKHKLDYRKSYIDNDIAGLKRKYQGHIDENGKYREGSATIISRAKSPVNVPKRQGAPRINEDGSLYYKTADDLTYVDKNGKVKTHTQKSTKMAEASDALDLVSETMVVNGKRVAVDPKEAAYAAYANSQKELGRRARVEMMNTGRLKYDSVSAKTYAPEVESLKGKLKEAQSNAPLERRAQMIANSRIKAKIQADDRLSDAGKEEMTNSEKKKLAQRELAAARVQVGARRRPIDINDREWEAIQSGAIHDSLLSDILKYADTEQLRQRATPRSNTQVSDAVANRIRALRASGYTTDQIAQAVGKSTSTINKYLHE